MPHQLEASLPEKWESLLDKILYFLSFGGIFNFFVKWPIFDNSIIKGEILFFVCHPDIFSGPIWSPYEKNLEAPLCGTNFSVGKDA